MPMFRKKTFVAQAEQFVVPDNWDAYTSPEAVPTHHMFLDRPVYLDQDGPFVTVSGTDVRPGDYVLFGSNNHLIPVKWYRFREEFELVEGSDAHETVIEATIELLRKSNVFFPCKEHTEALHHLHKALSWLSKRRETREYSLESVNAEDGPVPIPVVLPKTGESKRPPVLHLSIDALQSGGPKVSLIGADGVALAHIGIAEGQRLYVNAKGGTLVTGRHVDEGEDVVATDGFIIPLE